MGTPNKILAFAASNSSTSINKMLVTHAANVLKEEMIATADITILDLNDYEMPIYSTDRENSGGIPEQAQAFYKAIGDADALLISYAEYNGSYSSAYKNIFDWCSRINSEVFQGKPMVIMSSSPGPYGASNVLKTASDSAAYFAADIRGSLSVGNFYDTFDSDKGQLSDANLAAELRAQLAKLV